MLIIIIINSFSWCPHSNHPQLPPANIPGANKRNWRSCATIGLHRVSFYSSFVSTACSIRVHRTNANVDDNIFRWLLADRLQRACRIWYIECKQIQWAAFGQCLYSSPPKTERGRNRMNVISAAWCSISVRPNGIPYSYVMTDSFRSFMDGSRSKNQTQIIIRANGQCVSARASKNRVVRKIIFDSRILLGAVQTQWTNGQSASAFAQSYQWTDAWGANNGLECEPNYHSTEYYNFIWNQNDARMPICTPSIRISCISWPPPPNCSRSNSPKTVWCAHTSENILQTMCN